MANTRFGNFSELSQGKKPMTAEEAWIMLNELGLLGQEFIPGATSVRKLMEGKPKEAVEELQDWIPGNAAYQNFIRGKEQDWLRNALDAMIIAKPVARGAKKVAEAIEKMPKGGKEGFANAVFLRKSKKPILVKPETMSGYERFCAAIDEGVKKGEISPADGMRFKQNAFANIQTEAKIKSMAAVGKYDMNRSDQYANRIYREDIPESSREYFDFASSVGENAGKELKQYPVGVNRVGQKIYSKGDQGNLLWNEHVMDANTSRHALSDYDKKQDEINQILKKAYPGLNEQGIAAGLKTYDGYKNIYKTVAEPAMSDAAEKKLGFNYKEAADKSFNEGTRMTKENPKYMTVKDFYKFMFDLE